MEFRPKLVAHGCLRTGETSIVEETLRRPTKLCEDGQCRRPQMSKASYCRKHQQKRDLAKTISRR